MSDEVAHFSVNCYTAFMNLTIDLAPEHMQRLATVAASDHQSASEWAAGLICRTLETSDSLAADAEFAVNALTDGFDLGGETWSREDLYDRGSVR